MCKLISFWIFKYCFYYSFTLYYCAIFYSLEAGVFQYHPGVKQIGSRSGPTFCGPDLGPNCLQQQKSPLVGKKLNTKQLVDTTFCLKPWLKLISVGSIFFHFAKVLATTNSETGYYM